VDLRPVDRWDCGFESRRGHGCLSVLSVVCWLAEVSASFVHRSPTECGVSVCDREASINRRSWTTRGCCAPDGLMMALDAETYYRIDWHFGTGQTCYRQKEWNITCSETHSKIIHLKHTCRVINLFDNYRLPVLVGSFYRITVTHYAEEMCEVTLGLKTSLPLWENCSENILVKYKITVMRCKCLMPRRLWNLRLKFLSSLHMIVLTSWVIVNFYDC